MSTIYAFKSFRDSNSLAFPYQVRDIKQTVESACSYLIAWMRAKHAAHSVLLKAFSF